MFDIQRGPYCCYPIALRVRRCLDKPQYGIIVISIADEIHDRIKKNPTRHVLKEYFKPVCVVMGRNKKTFG